MMGPDRRQFLQGAVGIGAVAAIAGGIGRVLKERFEVDPSGPHSICRRPSRWPSDCPPTLELGVEGIDPFVVPNASFYRIDTALVVPQVRKTRGS